MATWPQSRVTAAVQTWLREQRKRVDRGAHRRGPLH